MKKQLISIIIMIVMLFTFFQVGSFAEVITSGICGYDNLAWNFDESTKTLTITGNGSLEGHGPGSVYGEEPWRTFKDNIQHLVLSEGVTSLVVAEMALKSIAIPTSLTSWYYTPTFISSLTDIYYAGHENDLYTIIRQETIEELNIAIHCDGGYFEGASGSCGQNLTWTFDRFTETLTISGTGKMDDYDYELNSAPWSEYKIKHILLTEGVTSIGQNAFDHCSNATEITIPKSVTEINWQFLWSNSKIPTIYYSGSPNEFNAISGINQYDFNDVTIHYGAQDSPVPQNKCGENVYWEFDASTATLTISGSGEMDEYNSLYQTAPWEPYQENIKHLVVSEGVTYFSGGSIAIGHTALTTITFPKSLTGSISYISLMSFPTLTDVFYAGNITNFYALFGGYSLEIPNNVTVHYSEAVQDPTPSADVYYTENLPKSIKVGDLMPKADITFHNLTPGIEYRTYISDFTGENEGDPVFYIHPYDRFEGHSSVVDTDGTIKNQESASDEQVKGIYAYRPGYWKLIPQISAEQPPYGSWKIGNSIFVEVESPIITHTAPTAAVVGQTIQFNTALTNVNLKNYKVSDYENVEPIVCWTEEHWDDENTLVQTYLCHRFGNFHPIAYKPTVEVISGSDLIERKNKDYSNTLNSTESITFLKEGTITLRISYNQIKTMDCAAESFDYHEIVTIQIHKEHTYTNDCDTTCNICKATRSITHQYGNYIYNNDATAAKDGTKTRTCSVCGKKETITAAGTKWTNPFQDVKAGEYYTDPVLWAVGKKITNGMTADSFAPNNECTRGQIVTFLWRAAGSPEPTSTNNPFVDVKSDQYYYKAVLWAVEKGITNGMDATHFAPDSTCTRGQVVTFLWRANGKPAASGSNAFKDVKSGAYYYDAVRWAVKNNITNGMSATSFAPDTTCTRGQIVTFLYRAYN